MELDRLAGRYRDLWHVTFAGGWEGIHRHGLLRAVDVDAVTAREIRLRSVERTLSDGTRVTVRNQVMSRKDPSTSLDGISVEEWWQLINARVYFFCREGDKDRFVEAYLGQGCPQEVIKVRTKSVLAPVAEAVELATVNAGVFPRAGGPTRGRDTFVSLNNFPASEVSRIREVTVADRVSIPESAVVSVVRCDPDGRRTRVFP